MAPVVVAAASAAEGMSGCGGSGGGSSPPSVEAPVTAPLLPSSFGAPVSSGGRGVVLLRRGGAGMRLAEPERGIVGEGAREAAAAAPLLATGAVPGAVEAAVVARLATFSRTKGWALTTLMSARRSGSIWSITCGEGWAPW